MVVSCSTICTRSSKVAYMALNSKYASHTLLYPSSFYYYLAIYAEFITLIKHKTNNLHCYTHIQTICILHIQFLLLIIIFDFAQKGYKYVWLIVIINKLMKNFSIGLYYEVKRLFYILECYILLVTCYI